ncbi:MAG: glycoside hydrolase family 127 protein, partial [Brevefilum sp.]
MSSINLNRKPVSFEKVKIQDAFWLLRMRANHTHGLEAVYQQLKKTGRLAAYDLDWEPGSDSPQPHVFWDSDVAKWIEGACYCLINQPDASLRERVEEVVDKILSAQGEDGYLNPHFSVVEPEQRWANLRDKHELYCAGHLIEAAIAHHRASGDRRFLDGMMRYADLIDRVFGPRAHQKQGYPGHEELEMALVKLYRHTGKSKFLELAAYFIDERGRVPHYFDIEARERGEDPGEYWAKSHAYTQSHLPVREQKQVVGHAVRAMYLYSGMADLAAEIGDETLFETLRTLWADLTGHKLYLTGGIGPSRE